MTTEDIEMFARKGLFSSIGRAAALATVAALALTALEPSKAVAGPAKEKGLTTASGTSDATDFSSRRRYYRGGGAAAAAAFAGIVGTGIAIAAANSRRDYYYDSYGYYGGGARSITVAPPTTAAVPTTETATAITAATPACPIIKGIRSQAGNHNTKDRSAGRFWPAECSVAAQHVNTLATAFD